MDTTPKNWALAALTITAITCTNIGLGHLIIEALAATGIGTPQEITHLIARGN